jgi:hypothetical protein
MNVSKQHQEYGVKSSTNICDGVKTCDNQFGNGRDDAANTTSASGDEGALGEGK